MGKNRSPRQRQLRVGEAIRHALATVFDRDSLRDPALQGVSITVTEVRASPDLKNATVYVMPLGGGDAEAVVEALTRATAFLRGALAKEIDLRHVPRLEFQIDPSFGQADHVDSLLRRPQVARDLDHEKDGDGL